MTVDRRRILQGLASGAAVALLPGRSRASDTGAAPSLPDYPFRLGVASGYPTDRSVVLWTRLAPQPDAPAGGMHARDHPLRYEVAEDEGFRRIIARGTTVAPAAAAHSVHLEVGRLRPARDYWYRFMADSHVSAVGRTRTLPAARDRVAALRLAVACCQHYETGQFAGYRHMAAAAPDAILHLGDYIYEGGRGGGTRLRYHTGDTCLSLEDFRRRYALYQSDPSLQAAHASAPWFITWDDHEVQNDYAGDTPGRRDDFARFAQRRAAAYQAWYEHMPVPPAMAPRAGGTRIYTRARIGRLVTLHVLDQRQYRSREACPQDALLGGVRVGDACVERLAGDRTMLGEAQERWLEKGLREQAARWTLLGQGTIVTHMNQGSGSSPEYWTDSWTGYPVARQRLLDTLQRTRSNNPVVLSGDIHAFMAAGINAIPERPDSPLLAAEFAATSISSNPIAQPTLDHWREMNPGVQRLDGSRRGYLSLTLSEARLQADLVAVDDPRLPESGSAVMASHVVESGSPRILPG